MGGPESRRRQRATPMTKAQMGKAFSTTSDTEGTTVLLLKLTPEHARKRYNPARCTFTAWLGVANDN